LLRIVSNVSTPAGAWATIIAFALVGVISTVVVPVPLVTWVLTGKTLVSAELPARTDTAISYNNLKDKPTIPTLPAEITDAQVTSGVGTTVVKPPFVNTSIL
jgi:hypothetical protein